MSLRKRIEKSERLVSAVARLLRLYLGLVQRRTKWESEGVDDLRTALADGPVLLVMWHSRLVMGAHHWPIADGNLSSLHDTSPVARVAGALHRQVGLQPMKMSRKTSNITASRTVLKRIRDGISIGMTADGPLGPAMQVNDATMEWARVTGAPIFCYAFSTIRQRRMNSWDQMLMPGLFGRGAYVFRRFAREVPRKAEPAQLEALREALCGHIKETTARADELVGLEPGA